MSERKQSDQTDMNLSVIDEDTAVKNDWLPDFGAPVATRDRAQYHEPTGGTHYSGIKVWENRVYELKLKKN